jgi:hypothetical protein
VIKKDLSGIVQDSFDWGTLEAINVKVSAGSGQDPVGVLMW